MPTTENPTITLAPKPKAQKSQAELEIERLSSLSADSLNVEDMNVLRRLRDARASLIEIEAELENVKDRKKLRKEALEEAIHRASMYFEHRQLALNFGR